MKVKKRLTRSEEFEIMKLVLDKFLWLGFGIMAYGFYQMVKVVPNFVTGIWVMVGGAIILLLLTMILIREYEFMK